MTDEPQPVDISAVHDDAFAAPLAPSWEENQRPVVAAVGRPRGFWLISGSAILMGAVALFWLGARRTAEATETPSRYVTAPPVPSEIANFASVRPGVPATAVVVPPPRPDPETPAPTTSGATDDAIAEAQAALAARLRAPALVIDLGDQQPAAQDAPPPPPGGSGDGPMSRTVDAGAPTGPSGLNGDEQFAHRVNAQEPDHSEATRIDDLRDTIPQGAMIPGVMETALDSDLPGYTRAVVSRDVRGFDGSQVLIPRGSRVIGEYKNAPAEGQSRAFIVWTRIIRPDGVTIQIGSSGTDPLGRAGVAGSVDRHIIERYGGAILLSVLDAGIASLSREPSTQVVIGSATGAAGLGAGAMPTSISPTIKVPQGSPIRIFVARDLDFSAAEHVTQ